MARTRSRTRGRTRGRTVPAAVVAVIAILSWQGLRVRGDEGRGDGLDRPPGVAEVRRVVDGDTIVVRVQGHEERVRLIGIDTPESVDRRRPVECYGNEAARHTASLLPPRTQVRLVRDVEARDAYGRLLAYVYRLPEEDLVNLRLVRDGYAVASTYPPNVAHASELVAAAADARRAGRGLWSACPPSGRSPP